MKFRTETAVFLMAATGFVLGACAPRESSDHMLGEEPGERGTFVALGMDVDTEAHGTLLQVSDSSAPVSASQKTGGSSQKSADDFVLLKSDTKGVTIGTVFQGDQPLSKNEANTFIPASITKVVTSALALKVLGPDFRYKTRIVWDESQAGVAENLTVIADGDPTPSRAEDPKGLARARLQEIGRTLRSRGIKKIAGSVRVVSVDERRDIAAPTVGVDRSDNLQCFGAIAQSFNFNWNCAILSVVDFEKARWADGNLIFQVTLNMTRGERNRISVNPQFDSIGRMASVSIEGVWGTKEPKAYGITVAIPTAKDWYARALVGELAKQGIDARGVSIEMPSGSEAERIVKASSSRRSSFEIFSPTLAEIMIPMNKQSDNFLADTLFKSVAEKHSSKAPDLRQAGAWAMRETIQAWMDRNGHREYASEIHLIDGSGLTRENRASPRAFLALLKEFSKEPSFVHLWESLPVAGRDGTLAGRMGNTAAAGFVRAKTGTVRGAYQLAGFIPKMGSGQQVVEYIPFVILSAAGPNDKDKIRLFQDKLVARLMEVVNPSMKTLAKAQ